MNKPIEVSGSLRNRLAITLIGSVALLTILLYIVVRDYAAQIAQQSQDNILRASVTSMLDTASLRDGKIVMDIPYASFSMLGTYSDDRIFYAIYENDKLLSGYDDLPLPGQVGPERVDPEQVDLEQLDNAAALYQTINYLDVPVRQVSLSRTLVGAGVKTRVTVSIAQTQYNLAGTLSRISYNAALYGAGFFSLAVLLSVWVSSYTINPLKKLANSVARRGPQDLSPVSKVVPSEMAPLVASLNHLMARLERSFSQSEEFIAEAAHRVRTPLSTVRSHAETTLQRVDKEDNRQALRSMIRAIDESSRAATQLLDHAMIAFRANQLELSTIDLKDLTTDIAMRLNPIADMKDVELRVQGDSNVQVSGDPILIQNAVRNVIDNALKYSPSESNVEITVRATPTPNITFRDCGTGFPPDEINELPKRFTRGTNAAGTIGSGLGLAIAQDVAIAHGGKLSISNSDTGGACVTLSF